MSKEVLLCMYAFPCPLEPRRLAYGGDHDGITARAIVPCFSFLFFPLPWALCWSQMAAGALYNRRSQAPLLQGGCLHAPFGASLFFFYSV